MNIAVRCNNAPYYYGYSRKASSLKLEEKTQKQDDLCCVPSNFTRPEGVGSRVGGSSHFSAFPKLRRLRRTERPSLAREAGGELLKKF